MVEVLERSAEVLADLRVLVDIHFREEQDRLAALVQLGAPVERLEAAVPRGALQVRPRAPDRTSQEVLAMAMVVYVFQVEVIRTLVATAAARYSTTSIQDSPRLVVELQQELEEGLLGLVDSVETNFPEETLVLKVTLDKVWASMETLEAVLLREALSPGEQTLKKAVPGNLVHGVPEGTPMVVQVLLEEVLTVLAASTEALSLAAFIQVSHHTEYRREPAEDLEPMEEAVLKEQDHFHLDSLNPRLAIFSILKLDTAVPSPALLDGGRLDSVSVGGKQTQEWLQQ